MKSYVFTPDAERDLSDIVDFISRHSHTNALKVFDKIHVTARKLVDSPGIGHRRDDLANEILRVWSVYSFLIIYRPQTKPLEIIRILHGARDIGLILGSNAKRKR
jgi:plasmid stabilization system protein ParE